MLPAPTWRTWLWCSTRPGWPTGPGRRGRRGRPKSCRRDRRAMAATGGGGSGRSRARGDPDPGSLDPLGPDERVDDLGVELDPGELAQLGQGLLRGQRDHPIWPLGGHRLERVGAVEDPGQLRDLLTDQPIRIARAVVPLVVVADDRQLRGQLGDRGDDLRTEHRVAVHDRPLILGQPVRLEQNVIRDADLPDVVEQAAPLQGLHLRLVAAHDVPDVARDHHHPTAVHARRWIALVDGLSQRPDRLREHLAHLDKLTLSVPSRIERQCEE